MLALVGGALLTFAFAPFEIWPLAVLAPALLFALLEGAAPRRAARLGFSFGVGCFAAGTWWLYFSIQGFGGAPVWLALLLVGALVAAMAGYVALFAALAARLLPAVGAWRWLAGLPALWWLIEWLRGWFLSGFGWLSLGYSQTDTWLAGFAPVGGAHLVSFLLAMMAGALVMLRAQGLSGGDRRGWRRAWPALAALLLPWPVGAALDRVEWTTVAGPPVRVSVVQGAIPQDEKWVADNLDATIARYRDMTLRELGTPLVVWPESAIPDLAHNYVDLLKALSGAARERGSALLLGMIREEAVPAGEPPRYFNSILALDRELQFHDKHHLVPFAEFFPVPQFVRRWMRMMNLPYSDFTPGGPAQAPLRIAGLVLEASICYEDAYAATRLRGLRDATALVNVTNDAWFAHSPARYQHLQISRMRAIEARRFLIRAANDGVSAVVGPYGELQASAPEYRPAVLRAAVIPRTGLPPYARTGDLPLTVAAVLLVLAAAWLRWRSAGASPVAAP